MKQFFIFENGDGTSRIFVSEPHRIGYLDKNGICGRYSQTTNYNSHRYAIAVIKKHFPGAQRDRSRDKQPTFMVK